MEIGCLYVRYTDNNLRILCCYSFIDIIFIIQQYIYFIHRSPHTLFLISYEQTAIGNFIQHGALATAQYHTHLLHMHNQTL